MNRPLATIGIPTIGGRSAYFRSALDSALAQTYAPLEILVGDNSANAGVQASLSALTGRDPRIRYFHHASRVPFAVSWNSLVTNARGEYLAFLADDDRLHPTFIEDLMGLREANPGAQVFFSNHAVIDSDGHLRTEAGAEFAERYRRAELPPGLLPNPELTAWRNSIPMVSMMASTALLRALPFRDDLNTPEIEFFLRAAQRGVGFVYTDAVLADYRVHLQTETQRGLMVDRLAAYLLPLAASAGCEEAKRQRLSDLLPGAVTRTLLEGDARSARAFVRSEYYPPLTWRHPTTWLHRVCVALPDDLASATFRALYRFGRQAVARRASQAK